MTAWVGLSLLPGVGPRTIRRWVERAGSAEAVWRHLAAFLDRAGGHDEVLAAWRTADPIGVVARSRELGLTMLSPADPAYPPLLRTIPDPPPVLYVRGIVDVGPAVAIVGSRRATPYGRAVAERLAFDLAAAGVTVVSGLARGIDGAAHRGALDGGGRTVAVLGCGLDVTYPREHRQLAGAIAGSGALVSEFPPGVPPLPSHFPRRNRIISGLSLGVVVVEGAEDSGALITADCALDQGREVFAVPGSVLSRSSRAPHTLLRQGARIVESAADIREELGLVPLTEAGRPPEVARPPDGAPLAQGETSGEAAGETRLLAALEAGPCQIDELIARTGLSAGEVAALVTILELRGLARTLPGQMVIRRLRR